MVVVIKRIVVLGSVSERKKEGAALALGGGGVFLLLDYSIIFY